MSHQPHEKPIPHDERRDRIEGIHKVPLIAAFGVAALVAVGTAAHVAAFGPAAERRPALAPVAERTITVHDVAGGRVEVRDAGDETVLAGYGPGEGAFLRQAMRALVATRERKRLALREPFNVVRAADGKLFVTDPTTGQRINITAFGGVARATFAPLLPTDKGA